MITAALVALAACGGDADPTEPAGTCGTITKVEVLASPHQDPVDPDAWNSNPPTSGPHSPAWAGWDRSYAELAREHWVHNLEHGGVVLAYRCDAGCPDVVAALEDLARAVPDDPLCTAPIHSRVLVVADPLLPDGVQVAAVAWGVHYTASCLDAPTVAAFITTHVGQGTEAICADGLPFSGVSLF